MTFCTKSQDFLFKTSQHSQKNHKIHQTVHLYPKKYPSQFSLALSYKCPENKDQIRFTKVYKKHREMYKMYKLNKSSAHRTLTWLKFIFAGGFAQFHWLSQFKQFCFWGISIDNAEFLQNFWINHRKSCPLNSPKFTEVQSNQTKTKNPSKLTTIRRKLVAKTKNYT